MIPFCRRTYQPRILGSSGKIMMPADLNALHKYMMEIEGISVISDEVPTVAPQMNFLTLRGRAAKMKEPPSQPESIPNLGNMG